MALEIEGLRPAVLSPATREDLEELLKFRHLVRNIYGFELEPGRVEQLVEMTVALFPGLQSEIERFCNFLFDLYKQT